MNAMKPIFQKILVSLFVTMAMISCSDNDKIDNNGEYGQYLQMKKDGTMWKTDDSFAVKFVEQGLGVDENADTYFMVLSAMQLGEQESFQIVLSLPLDKIDNPVGSYSVISDGTQLGMPGTAEVVYQSKTDLETIFMSRTDPEGSPPAGTLTITEFEKGDGAFPQRQINWLKGTFSVTLKGTIQGSKTGETIEITDGAFEIPNAILQLGK